MSELQERQKPVDRAICDAMVASTPETWNVIVLTLTGRPDRSIGALEHSLSSPEGHPPAAPHESLYAATRQLDALLREHGVVFVKATYTVELLPNSWKWRVAFEYGG